ncbi:MAG: hypothetical protein KAR09_04180, partial [Bacteroidales bacterium]|nr:hypothetical protein [Bacteroidales bacterium]
IWYISNKSGLVRFTKKDSTWKNYPISLDILGDSINTLHFKELTINEDYVFIPLSDNTSMTHGFVLHDRNTEALQYFSSEEFREAFFYYEGQFATYKNTTFARDRYNDTLFSFFRQLPEHHALIQLYELPTSGSYVWNMRYKTISKDDYFITSSIILDYPPTWFKGVLIKYADKRIKIVEFPHFVKNFSGSVLPYLISGDEFEIYVASQGRDDKGFFIYHVLDEEIESDPLWGETVGHISFIIDVGKYVIIGSYNKKLYSFNKSTKQIIDISEHISTFPKYCEMSAKFIYIGTNKELIYFDKDMNYCGKLHDGESTLHNTDYGLYLNTKHEVYILID